MCNMIELSTAHSQSGPAKGDGGKDRSDVETHRPRDVPTKGGGGRDRSDVETHRPRDDSRKGSGGRDRSRIETHRATEGNGKAGGHIAKGKPCDAPSSKQSGEPLVVIRSCIDVHVKV